MATVRGYVCLCVLGYLAVIVLGQDPCIKTYKPKINSCMETFGNMMEDLIANTQGGPSQPDVMGAACSKEGKAALTCVMTNVQDCPAVLGDPGTAELFKPLPVNMTSFMAQGGMDTVCMMMHAAGCQQIRKCFAMNEGPEPESNSPNDLDAFMASLDQFGVAKPYLFFQKYSGLLCGKMKTMLQCMMEAVKECPSVSVEQLHQMMSDTIKKSQPHLQGIRVTTLKEDKDFINQECVNLPDGFDSNQCVMTNLQSDEFTACHDNFTTEFSTEASKASCKAVFALKGCFENHIAPKCGKQYSNFLAKNAPLVVEGLTQDTCETSGTGVTQGSTIIMLGLATIIGLLV